MTETNQETPQAAPLAGAADLFTGKAPRRYDTALLPIKQVRVRFRSLNEQEMSVYEMGTLPNRRNVETVLKRMQNAARRLIVLCLVDQAGNRILGEEHLDKLGTEWDAADVAFLYDRIAKHVGVRTQDIEELAGKAKNSGDAPGD